MKQTYLICYDVSSNRLRSRLARLLEKNGERVQYSVFRCTCSTGVMEDLKSKILGIITEGDELLILPLCKNCFSKALRAGPSIPVVCVA